MRDGIDIEELISRPSQLGPPTIDVSLYDEDRALTEYVWRYYQNLLTAPEARAGLYLAGMTHDLAVASKGPQYARHLDEKFGAVTDQQIADALADGWDSLRTRTRDRLLRDCSDTVFINRCPQCRRVVRSPSAKQCHWCKHRWHGKTVP